MLSLKHIFHLCNSFILICIYVHFSTFHKYLFLHTYLKYCLSFLLAWKISLLSSRRSPSTGGKGKEGILLRRRAAFPLTRRTENLWNHVAHRFILLLP